MGSHDTILPQEKAKVFCNELCPCAFHKVRSCSSFPALKMEMKVANQVTIGDTEKSKNIQVEVNGNATLDEMEKILTNVSTELDLEISHITTLSRKKYPNNRHWHFKQDLKSKGCLDATYWPSGELFWITIRNYEPEWVHKAGRDMAALLKKKLTSA